MDSKKNPDPLGSPGERSIKSGEPRKTGRREREERKRKKGNRLVLVRFFHRVLTGRLAAGNTRWNSVPGGPKLHISNLLLSSSSFFLST